MRPIDRFLSLLDEERLREANRLAEEVQRRMEGRVLWNVNSTACGGRVATSKPVALQEAWFHPVFTSILES
jgi:hypothetical protein